MDEFLAISMYMYKIIFNLVHLLCFQIKLRLYIKTTTTTTTTNEDGSNVIFLT